MRLVTLLAAVAVVGVVGVLVWTSVLRPPPAAERLAGVSLAIASFTVDDLAADRHRLNLIVTVTSPVDLDACLAFALDEPFAGRRLRAIGGDACVRPRAGSQQVTLAFDGLSETDVMFPSHTLVWGVEGGRCGPILSLLGVCIVDQAGTAAIELPSRSVLPTFGPLGSLVPLFPEVSFEP